MRKIKSIRIRNIIIVLMFFLFTNNLSANNIQIANTTTTCRNTIDHSVDVSFDISWDNSWRISTASNNWDAAWVFIKYRKVGANGNSIWKHASLNYVDGTGANDGHTVPTNASISSTDIYGVFIYADADVTGSVNYTDAKLRWNYGADGIADTDSIEVNVSAIEMVYVPQASFYVGSGGNEAGRFYKQPTNTVPYQITSESAINFGTANNDLYVTWGNKNDGIIPTAYPKGYNAFYCMKYEITQAQYVAFLNSLDLTQSITRTPGIATNDRYGISGAYQNFSTTRPYVVCGHLNWADYTAYLDWAALRPMTELEYEKACRGTANPVPNEYAWGNAEVTTNVYTLNNSGLDNENVGNYDVNKGNAIYYVTDDNVNPVRAGVFAANPANTGRITSGATFYGIMEMSGNLYEYTICASIDSGRTFTNQNGNGILDVNGVADVPYWLNIGYGSSQSGFGGGQRGIPVTNYMNVSGRYLASSSTYFTERRFNYGGRGVRSAE